MHSFKCDGAIIYGPKIRNLLITTFVINLSNLIGICVIQQNIVSLVLSWILVDYFLYRSALSDPGILPRQPRHQMSKIKQKRKLIFNGNKSHLVEMKYCTTCHIIRPMGCSSQSDHRTVHCSQCDCCVQEFDHHCPWISNCIGKHNYFSFFMFISILAINIVLHLYSTSLSIAQNGASWYAVMFLVYLLPYLSGISYLLIYHCYYSIYRN